MFGGGGSIPKQEKLQTGPKPEDKAAMDAAADAVRKKMMGRGYHSTVFGAAMEGRGGKTTFGS